MTTYQNVLDFINEHINFDPNHFRKWAKENGYADEWAEAIIEDVAAGYDLGGPQRVEH